jgi:hypothetical protein
MMTLRVGLTDTEPQGEFVPEFCVGEKEVAALIQIFHQSLIGAIPLSQPETDEVELARCNQVEAHIFTHPRRELLRQSHVLADVMLQAFDPIVPDYEPQFE